jgi:peptidyl-tRNA hydrolase
MKRKAAADSPYRLYILMRTDLPSMNPGRAMAQAAHAANQFIHEYGKQMAVKTWQKDANGFGTTICLASTKPEIEEVVKMAKEKSYCNGLVYDPTYNFVVPAEIAPLIIVNSLTAPTIIKDNGDSIMFRNELTCAYIFIDQNSSDRELLVGNLKLHP